MFFHKIMATNAPAAVLMVGFGFLSEGIQKFLYSDVRGVGRFIKIGLPEPEMLAYFVAVLEVTCGSFIVLGLPTLLADIPTITVMLVAIATTKRPIPTSGGFWPAQVKVLNT